MLYSYLPSLDLHGESADISRILVDQFILDNYKFSKYPYTMQECIDRAYKSHPICKHFVSLKPKYLVHILCMLLPGAMSQCG